MRGLRYRVWGLGFSVSGLEFRVWGWFRVWGYCPPIMEEHDMKAGIM